MFVVMLQKHNMVPPTPLVSAQVLREEKEAWMDVQVIDKLHDNYCVGCANFMPLPNSYIMMTSVSWQYTCCFVLFYN